MIGNKRFRGVDWDCPASHEGEATMRSFWRAFALLLTPVPVVLGGACGEEDLASDLRPEGSPEVVEVNVRSQGIVRTPGEGGPSGLQRGEMATFCRSGDEYKLNFVYCPEARDANNAPIPGERDVEPVMDAEPKSWYVRLVFDELLDTDVERLVNGQGHIDQTRPVELRCADQDVDYDGWYEPSGSHLTYPPGPALVVTWSSFVATGTTDCEISIAESVVDKEGNEVPSGQRGPYRFGIAPLAVYGSSPSDMSEGVDVSSELSVEFNAPIDLATVMGRIVVTDPDDVEVPLASITHHENAAGMTDDESIVVLTPMADLAPETTYTIRVVNGVADSAGGALVQEEEFVASFRTSGGT
jgi:hypothetical protein